MKTTIAIELEVECSTSAYDALTIVSHMLDAGVPQDALNERAKEESFELRVDDASARLVPEPNEREALRAFVQAIDNAGGLIEREDGAIFPAGDHDWVDLAEAYFGACKALGIEVSVAKSA